MKAVYVQTFCCEGIMDWVHGGGSYVDGIFIPDENLMIRYKDKTAYVVEGKLDDFTTTSSGETELPPKVIREIQIPEELVATARTLISARTAFTNRVENLWNVFGLKS